MLYVYDIMHTQCTVEFFCGTCGIPAVIPSYPYMRHSVKMCTITNFPTGTECTKSFSDHLPVELNVMRFCISSKWEKGIIYVSTFDIIVIRTTTSLSSQQMIVILSGDCHINFISQVESRPEMKA